MPSPPRQSPGSPSQRAALHERSDSQTNQKPAPSLRVVGDPGASVYHSTPYPTKPSQILRPSRTPRGQAPALDHVSHSLDQHPRDNWTSPHTSRPRNNNSSREGSGRNTKRSSADVSFYTTSTEDSAPGSPRVAEPEANTNVLTSERGEAEREGQTERVSGDSVVQLPSVPPRARGHTLSPSVSSRETSEARQPATKESDSSLSSTNTTGTVIVRKTRDGRKRASYSAFPISRPSSSRSNLTISTPPRNPRRPSDAASTPRSPVSPSSPVAETSPSPRERRISSLPTEARIRDAARHAAELQYPIFKPQAASASWAESSAPSPQIPIRAPERALDRWNPHLSTVPSEGTSSISGERSSLGTVPVVSSRASRASSNVLSASRASSDLPPMPRRSLDQSPISEGDSSQRSTPHFSLPLPPPARGRDFTGSTIRMVREEDDPAPPTTAQSRDVSGATVRLVQEKENESSPETSLSGPSVPSNPTVIPRDNARGLLARPASRASFFRDSIPAWAR